MDIFDTCKRLHVAFVCDFAQMVGGEVPKQGGADLVVGISWEECERGTIG